MCRLFALHAGDRDVAADFWLLNAPTSIARQSEVNADGYGLAALTSNRGMILVRNPVQAASDAAYQTVAERLVASGSLRAVKIGRCTRVPEDALKALIEQVKEDIKKAKGDHAHDEEQTGPPAPPAS